MFNEIQADINLSWATNVAAILTEAAQDFNADVEALERKWKRQARVKNAYPEGIITIEDAFNVRDITVTIEVLSYFVEKEEKDVGWREGVTDVDFVVVNGYGRRMPWLEKHVTPEQIRWIESYIAERVL